MLKYLVTVFAFVSAAALPAFAHHSTVMFAPDKEVNLTGTVKAFEYANPHSSIQILVPHEGGNTVEWNIETVSPLVLDRAGIEANALRPGDQVRVRARPLKSGSRPSGWLIDVTKADGTVLRLPEPYTD